MAPWGESIHYKLYRNGRVLIVPGPVKEKFSRSGSGELQSGSKDVEFVMISDAHLREGSA